MERPVIDVDSKEQLALDVISMYREDVTGIITGLKDLPRFLSRLCVKKAISVTGKNTALICKLMGPNFQASVVLNMLEGEIAKNYEHFMTFIRTLKSEPLADIIATILEDTFKQVLDGVNKRGEVNFNADDDEESVIPGTEEITKSVVHSIALRGSTKAVKKYIEEKAVDAWTRDEYGNSLVHYAALCGNMDLLDYLVKEKFCSPTSQGEGGVSPLHLACQLNHLDLVMYLTGELQCDPNFPDEDGNIPLHFAAQHNAVVSAEYLIDQLGCDPMHKNNLGYTSIHALCQGGAGLDLLELMCKPPQDNGKGAQPQRTPCDLSSRSNEGVVPLHLACQSGELDVVKYLVENGCDPNSKDGYRKTPLHYASQNGKLDVVKYLRDEKGFDVKCVDKDGATPLDLAKNNCHLEVIRYLEAIPQ